MAQRAEENAGEASPQPESHAEAIARVVAESGILQKDWALRVGVSRAAISNWVRGENTPSERHVRSLIRAARAFELPSPLVDRLVGLLPEDAVAHPSAARPLAPAPTLADPELDRAWGELRDALAELRRQGRDDAVWRALVTDVAELADRARLAAAGGSVEKWIHRDAAYVLSLFTQLTLDLPDGHHYHTVSNMDFWSSYTLASRRVFLGTQERAVREGRLDVKRIFLLRRGSPSADEIERLAEHAHASPIPARVLVVPADEVEGIGNFVLCGPGMGDAARDDTALYQLTFRRPPGSEARELSRVSISSDARLIAEKRASFEAHFAEGLELRAFLDGGAE